MEVHYMTSSSSEDLPNAMEQPVDTKEKFGIIRVYPYRWLILALYSATSFSNTLVMLSLFTVSDATVAYYNITQGELLWSSMACTFLQVVVAIPITFLPSRLGLRTTMILAAIINALGASIMITSTHRNGFPYFVIGQVIIALAFAILPQLAPEVSAVWFGEKEHALSTSIGLIIGNAGAAVGFLQPALMISNIEPEQNIEFIGQKLRELIYSQAALCIFLLFLILFFFKKAPPSPPTLSQAMRTKDTNVTFACFKKSYKTLLKNKGYLLAGNSFAVNSVLVISVPLVLNGIMSWRFPHQDKLIGWMGFAGVIAGIIGSVVFSIVIDKTKEYKKMVFALGGVTLLSWLGFTETLAHWKNLPLICTLFVICIFVFFPTGPVLVDMISEMTYPIPESMSFVLPITVGRFYSLPIMFVLGYLIDKKDYHAVCLIIGGIMALSIVFVFFPKVMKRRTEAGKKSSNEELA